MLVAIAGMAASAVMVSAGEAIVVTQFGAVIRVITKPGLTWKAPGPVQLTTRVDLRLRTTSTGLQDVGTRDGLRILVQVYAGWSVPEDDSAIRQFLRAVGNDPDEAARQLRSFVGSALQVVASQFDLAELVNTDSSRVKLTEFEARLREQVEVQLRATYGIAVAEIGIERLTLPETTLAVTVARMRSERETVVAQRTAESQRQAGEIRSAAMRDQRVTVAEARERPKLRRPLENGLQRFMSRLTTLIRSSTFSSGRSTRLAEWLGPILISSFARTQRRSICWYKSAAQR
jgi:modulator of FtsH protease HflC